jgi:hypothetical protein
MLKRLRVRGFKSLIEVQFLALTVLSRADASNNLISWVTFTPFDRSYFSLLTPLNGFGSAF